MFRCEDFPACGHELGDCDGKLYGSDEDIKARTIERMEAYDDDFYDDRRFDD